jgi:uncharacterized protein
MSSDRRKFIAQVSLAGAAPALGAEGQPRSQELVNSLAAEWDKLEIVDSHEHTRPEADRVAEPADFFTLASHYLLTDAISAGLAARELDLVRKHDAPAAERWAAFEPYWKAVRFTGYGQALRIAIRDIYGFDEISRGTLPAINDAIRARNKPGLYRYVLKQRARIRYALVDDNWNAAPVKLDPEFFVPARKFDRYIMPATPGDVKELEKLTGVAVTSLKGLKQAMEKSFEQSIAVGMGAVKSTIAYDRVLHFREVEEADAARDFERVLKGSEKLPAGFRRRVERPFRNLEDHMFHHLIRLAEAHRYPVQLHTGLTAGPGFVTNTNPTHLTNVFFLYPKVKFDLFHMSYPYQKELAVLGKLFPNVYVDLCWAHIIAPGATRRALSEFLETVPANKILGFGGDYRFPELTYAHAQMAKRNIAMVLAAKVEEGVSTQAEAVDLGRMLLADNAAALFPRRS